MMKLYYTPIEKLIHKVQVVAIEAGVYDQIERIPTRPLARGAAHVKANPLSKVPTLELADGTGLYGGPVIYEYLDSLNPGEKLFPAPGPERWLALRQLALGDMLFETASLREREKRRPDQYVFQEWVDNYSATIARGMDRLEADAATMTRFTVGTVSIACGLMYFDVLLRIGRIADDWRTGRPALARWYDRMLQRPSMRWHDDDFRIAFDKGDNSSRIGFPKKAA